jgi:hypothetical protein
METWVGDRERTERAAGAVTVIGGGGRSERRSTGVISQEATDV